jgi:hypothetical protein
MARLSDLKLKHRLFLQAYPFRRVDCYPLGEPNNLGLQKRIMLAAFDLLSIPVSEPLIVKFSGQ